MPPIGKVLDNIFLTLGFSKICDGRNLAIYDIPGMGGVAAFIGMPEYLGDEVDGETEAALLYVGLNPSLEHKVTQELGLQFGMPNG
ncbi:hypothetical protein FJZ18_03140 [Candidatus Pacearchaeota archaeon]|nr:hypothetical protein [Candidatus Pacearchaeota archaeon]